jgi:predicted dehydrogenase
MGIPGGSGGINVLHGDGGLEAVLNNPDVDGVMLVLPITKHPELVLRALRAGKHVMSEKPVGKDVKTARETIEEYEKVYKPKGLIWRVAESE